MLPTAKTFSLLEAAGALGSLDTSISTLVLEDNWGTWKGFRLNSDMLTEKCPSWSHLPKVRNVALVSIPRGGDLAQLIFNILHTRVSLTVQILQDTESLVLGLCCPGGNRGS